jgi:hypothetical protein
MKVYLIKDSDFEMLLTELDRDPRYGQRGGSSVILSPVKKQAYEEVHAVFNHRVREWIDKMKGGG